MKLLILLLFISLFSTLFSQSKKKQIQILSNRWDSLKAVQSTEKQNFETRKNELESSISNTDKSTDELLKTLANKKENLRNEIQENKKLEKEILSLQIDLNSIEDSIQDIVEVQPIKFIESSSNHISDQELIDLTNIKDEELGDEFINQFEPTRKPTYSILGKQFFELQGSGYCLIVIGVQNPNDEHAASGTNFIALFEIDNDSLILKNKPFNAKDPYGEFGNPADFDKFVQFGDQKLAIILEGGYVGMGISIENISIYGLDNDNNIHLIYEGQKHEDDQANKGAREYKNLEDEYVISFQKSPPSKYYDLIETKISHGKKVKTRILKFNENAMKYE